VVIRDASSGASFAQAALTSLVTSLDSHLQFVECGAYGTVGGPYENMAKYSEAFSVATWDRTATFVQFYPTRLEVASRKGTLNPAYASRPASEK
jgi:hypothetical protein